MKRVLASAVTIAFAAAMLVGCAGSYSEQENPPTSEVAGTPTREVRTPSTAVFVQELPDGRTVLCVWAQSSNKGGLSCDWQSISKSETR